MNVYYFVGIVKNKEGNLNYKEVSQIEYNKVLESRNGTGIQVITNIKVQLKEVRVGLINSYQSFSNDRTLRVKVVNYEEKLFVPTT